MAPPPHHVEGPLSGKQLESSLSDTAAKLDGLERSGRSLWGVNEAAAPALVGDMKTEKDRQESGLIQQMQEFVLSLGGIRSELRRCDHNLEVLQRHAEELSTDEAKEELERARAAQEVQRQRAARQWPEVLDAICRIAVALQWSHGLPASLPASPASFPGGPGGPHPPGPPHPGAGCGIDDLMSMGPTHEL